MICAWSLYRPRPERDNVDPWIWYRVKVNELITLELLIGLKIRG